METDFWDQSRTVVVSGVPDVLPGSRMADKLTIHFQSRRTSHGGDVEQVRYPAKMEGVAFVTFDKAEDAERVVRKERQVLTDVEFPEVVLLTVFPFTADVFLYVSSAKVDLSLFDGDLETLIQSLRSAHRSLRFQPRLRHRKATVEGPFAAVKALREDLIRRARRLKSAASPPTAAVVRPKESPLNPRLISHHRFDSPGCSKAEREPAGSNGLSTPLQSTGEATRVQSPLSNAKTLNASSRQKLPPAVGSFCDTDGVEEEKLGPRAALKKPTAYRAKQAEANPRQAFGEAINAGIRSPLSGLDLGPAEEEITAGVDNVSQKHARPDRISANKTRGENHVGSRHNSSDDLQESDRSSSKLLGTRLKDVSTSSGSNNAEDAEELCAICPEDTCIWADLYTFRYVKKYNNELLRYLKDLKVSVKRVGGADLVRIAPTEKPTSTSALRVQQVLKIFKNHLERESLNLRVHQIPYDEQKLHQRQKLAQICDDVSSAFDDVLYVLEDSCIKVVGPSVNSYLFRRRLEDRLKSKTFL